MQLGLDEAGRGPVLGPLVVAGVWLEDEAASSLAALGVNDSKKLTAAKREELFDEIHKLASFVEVVSCLPAQIDEAILSGKNLTGLELDVMSSIARMHPSSKSIVDCPSVNTQSVHDVLLPSVTGELFVEHKADANHVVVAAASIIAKVTRDRAVSVLEKKIGVPIGSGYPNDPVTKAFLAKHFADFDFFAKHGKRTRMLLISRKI